MERVMFVTGRNARLRPRVMSYSARRWGMVATSNSTARRNGGMPFALGVSDGAVSPIMVSATGPRR